MIKHIISFDAESNGLEGDIFAIGAVLASERGIVSQFSARAPTPEPTNEWVAANVLPQLLADKDMNRYSAASALLDGFWEWLQTARSRTPDTIIMADFGVPVEARLLNACVFRHDPTKRIWQLPLPLHELGTLLLAYGIDPDIKREEFIADEIAGRTARKHHPLWDAEVSAICGFKLLRSRLQGSESLP